MASMAGCIRCIASSGSGNWIRPVELLMSAKKIVRCLRSPPVTLSARNISSAGRREGTLSGALHLPQNRLLGPLTCPHAAHTICSGFPQVSQNAFVALLSLLQYRQSIRGACTPLFRQQDIAGQWMFPWSSGACLPAAPAYRLVNGIIIRRGCRTSWAENPVMAPPASLEYSTSTGKLAPNAGTVNRNVVSPNCSSGQLDP